MNYKYCAALSKVDSFETFIMQMCFGRRRHKVLLRKRVVNEFIYSAAKISIIRRNSEQLHTNYFTQKSDEHAHETINALENRERETHIFYSRCL